MPTRPATWRSEKVESFSTWAIRLARKVSPKSRASLMAWCEYYIAKLLRQAAGFTLGFVMRGGTAPGASAAVRDPAPHRAMEFAPGNCVTKSQTW